MFYWAAIEVKASTWGLKGGWVDGGTKRNILLKSDLVKVVGLVWFLKPNSPARLPKSFSLSISKLEKPGSENMLEDLYKCKHKTTESGVKTSKP